MNSLKRVYFKSLLIGGMAIISHITLASENAEYEHVHGAHTECHLPSQTSDIVDCSIKRHPNVRRSQLDLAVGKAGSINAKQIPNPKFSGKHLTGEEGGEQKTSTEINLAFTLELGGKRSARIAKATNQEDIIGLALKQRKVEAKIETILNLNRLRQIQHEKKSVQETFKAYRDVISQLKKRPRLSAEQRASLTLFEMGYEESKIVGAELFEEEREIEHFFHVSTGHSLDEIKKFLPKEARSWPSFKIETTSKDLSSIQVQKLGAFTKVAKSELEVQRSKRWPDLSIGPSVNIEKTGSEENQMIGFNISMPLPLLNQNNGERALAAAKLEKFRKLRNIVHKEEVHEKHEQIKIYNNSLNVLKKLMSEKLILKKYLNVKKLYLRGVVSSSDFLESLKQKQSLLNMRHGKEMTALTALWEIYKLDGKVLKVKI